MKISLNLFVISSLFFVACASKPTYDEALLEKYPKCYHRNVKIYQRCVDLNEKGKKTTTLDVENSGVPIYK